MIFAQSIEGVQDIFLVVAQQLHSQGPIIRGRGEHLPGPLVPLTDSPHIDHLRKGQRRAKGAVDETKGQIAHPAQGRKDTRKG